MEHHIGLSLSDLAAQILRVSRGSGNPDRIIPLATEFLRLSRGYYEQTNGWPSEGLLIDALEVSRTRKLMQQGASKRFSKSDLELMRAEDQIVSGALQISASRLQGQPTQEAAGIEELHRGVQRVSRATSNT